MPAFKPLFRLLFQEFPGDHGLCLQAATVLKEPGRNHGITWVNSFLNSSLIFESASQSLPWTYTRPQVEMDAFSAIFGGLAAGIASAIESRMRRRKHLP